MQTTLFPLLDRSGRLVRQLVAASLFGALMLAPVAGFVFATDMTSRNRDDIAFHAPSLCTKDKIGCIINPQGHSSTFSNR